MKLSPRFSSQSLARGWVWLLAPLAALGCGPAADAQNQTAQAEAAESAPASGDEAKLGESWVRLIKDGDATLALETAIVRFVPGDDYEADKAPGDYDRYVDLVGAVHIGDHAYYAKLNRRFRDYDAVLYELVAAGRHGRPARAGDVQRHVVGALQNAMKSMLEVDHQLEQIDYTRPNFVHADISPEEFSASMERRDESFLQMYLRDRGRRDGRASKECRRRSDHGPRRDAPP